MPKILLGISSSFCANFLKGQVHFLVKNGWEVVIISGPGEEIALLAKKENAKLHTINFTKSILPFSDLLCLWKIIRILQREKPDIVNAGNPKSGFLIMLACWMSRLPKRIFTMHGLVADSRNGLSKFVIRLTEKISCSIAKKVIVVSPSLLEHAVNLKLVPIEKCIVLENGSCNGVNTSQFNTSSLVLEEANRLRKDLNVRDNEFVIGFVGRLSREKGLDLLFEAFNIIKQRNGNVRLMLAGPIEKENPFSKLFFEQMYQDEKISYLGKLYDVVPVYALLDVLVLSSLREGFGNVLIEAASMEVPVIAPDIPGCRHALRNNYNGFLFKKNDVQNLVTCIETYMSNCHLKKEHGKNGRIFVSTQFSQEKIWEGQLQLYNYLHKQ